MASYAAGFSLPVPPSGSSPVPAIEAPALIQRTVAVLKRSLDQLQEGIETALLPKKKKVRYAEENAFFQLIPEHQGAANPFSSVDIEVTTPEGECTLFPVPKMVLKNLSPYFCQLFSEEPEEGEQLCLKWEGVHFQAAVHILEFAHVEANIFDTDERTTLNQLRAQFPRDFLLILGDIIKLSNRFQIAALREECLEFFSEQLQSDALTTISLYAPGEKSKRIFEKLYTEALENYSADVNHRLSLYPVLISLFQKSETRDHNNARFAFFQCLVKALDDQVRQEGDEKEIHEIIPCAMALYPSFDFPDSVSRGILTLWPRVPESYHHFIQFAEIYLILSGYIEEFNADLPPMIPAQPLGLRIPPAKGALKEYQLLKQVFYSPPETFMDTLNGFISQYPNNLFALKFRARFLFSSGELEASIRDLDHVLHLDPWSISGWLNRGRCHLLRKNANAALADFEAALKLEKDHPMALLLMSDAYFQKKEFRAAVQHLDRALDQKKLNLHHTVKSLNAKGKYLLLLKDQEGAFHSLKLAIDLMPNTDSFKLRAYFHLYLGNLEGAKSDAEQLLQIDPQSAEGYVLRGELNLNFGSEEEALIDLDRAIVLKPNFATAHSFRGEYYRRKGEFEEAKNSFQRALDLNPRDHFALSRMGDCWRKQGDVEKAFQYFAQAVEADPKDPMTLVFSAQCYLEIGDDANAAEDLKMAYALAKKMITPLQRELALKECAELEKQIKERYGR